MASGPPGNGRALPSRPTPRPAPGAAAVRRPLLAVMWGWTRVPWMGMKTGPSSCLEEQFGNTSQSQDEVAEWLRRWTANPLCSARVGSNPILVVWLSLWPSAVAQLVKKPPPSLQEPWVQPMCGKGVHSGVLALRIPWTTVHLFTKSGTGLSDFHFYMSY